MINVTIHLNSPVGYPVSSPLPTHFQTSPKDNVRYQIELDGKGHIHGPAGQVIEDENGILREALHSFLNVLGRVQHNDSSLWEKEEPQKYKNSCLTEEKKQEYYEQILECMDDQAPYLQKNFTLKAFAEIVGIQLHHISQVINEKAGYNFSDFVNSYRVEYVKQNLNEEILQRLTISGVSYEAGFNSRAAFYNAFKKFVNMSPGEYIRRKQADMIPE